QGRELPAEASGRKGFQRLQPPAYVIDADVMAVTIEASNHSAHQKHCGDTITGPPALRWPPKPQLD
ncbi:hypothetical protein, partial [Aphanothece microscopica]|uniref:hypothetical protein n=1 Tax=Aphanothece microscopica TaxID=1049561 RepID=UPI0039850E0B